MRDKILLHASLKLFTNLLHLRTQENVGVVSSYFVNLLNSVERGRTSNWILMTPMLALANSAWVYWLCWLCCFVEITLLNTSKFYYLDELCGNERVFVLSFVSSNNTDVETAEQFILLYTRYVCDSLLLTLETRRQNLCRTLFSSRLAGFLAFDPRWILWCFPLKEVSPQDCLLIPKVNYRTIHPEKLFSWPPVCLLLASEKVVNFFRCEDCWLSFCVFGVSWRLK